MTHARWETVKAKAARKTIDEKIHWLEGYITGLKTAHAEMDSLWSLTEEEQVVLTRLNSLISHAQDTLQALKKIPRTWGQAYEQDDWPPKEDT